MKQKYFRAIIFLSLTGLISGSLFANIYCSDNVSEWGVFTYDFINKMQSIDFDTRNLFQYILLERIKMWLFLGILSTTVMGRLLRNLYILFWSFTIGLTCSVTIMEHGFRGTLYFLVMSLAAQLILCISILQVMKAGNFFHDKRRYGDEYATVKWEVQNVIVLLSSSIIFLIASVMVETFFNINFVKIFY